MPVFVIYSETYTALSVYDRSHLDPRAAGRIVGILSAWEAALQTHGDRLAKVEVFIEDGELSWLAYEDAGWYGECGGDDDDE